MNFVVKTIKDISIGVYDGPHATPELHDEGAAVFLGISNLLPDGRIDLTAARWVAERDLSKWTRRVKPQANDIVFTYEATLNRYAIIPEDLCCCLGRRTALIRPDISQIDHRYLFYYFFSPQWRAQIEANTLTGATVDRIPLTTFPNFEVLVPELKKQEQIAEVLSAYDDLIATNQRRIALLEEAARRIYREWFVALRFPGHESVPVKDGMPEGWDFDVVGMFGKVETGKTPSTSNPDFFGGEIPFIKTPDMHGRMVTSSALQTLSNSGSDSQKNKLLPVGSVAVSCIGTVGVVSIIGQPSHTNQQINAIIPHKNFYRVYLYFALSELREYMLGLGGGSTMANISKSKFANMPILKPNDDVLSQFEEIVTPMVSQIEQLESACVKLVQARDLLLPKLMSGQLDVSNISLPDEVAL